MERIVNLHIEHLPEGVYLATSEDVPGLVAQGRTISETLEIARDVAKKLIEEAGGAAVSLKVSPTAEAFDYPMIVGT
jgi:predicted RNase H-like HicB family nuclease